MGQYEEAKEASQIHGYLTHKSVIIPKSRIPMRSLVSFLAYWDLLGLAIRVDTGLSYHYEVF